MSLQVRLRHALGERLMDLPDRAVERPLVVGRSREADLKIPSVTVANEHCALFVHEGQWVLQDTSGGATFVNGQGTEGPTPLYVGDVIVLGADANPASIEIDPAGVAQGLTGQPATSGTPQASAPVPSRAGVAAPAGVYYGGPPAAPAGYAAGPYPPQPAAYAPSAAAYGQAAASEPQEETVDWNQVTASAPTRSSAARRRKKSSGDGPMIVGILVGVAIIGGSAWFAYIRLHPDAPPPAPKTVRVDKPVEPLQNIFTTPSVGGGDPAPAPATSAPPRTSTPSRKAPAPGPEDAGEDNASSSATPAAPTGEQPSAAAPPPPVSSGSDDAGAKDKSWDEVRAAHILPNAAQAILKFDDYRTQHPGKNTKDLDVYMEDALDRLWWQRITMFYTKRQALIKEIAGKDKDIRQETSAAFKKTLADEKEKLQADLKRVQGRLVDDMGYTNEEAPDLDNPDVMEKLTKERDATRYGSWKVHTIKYIRAHHGQTEWDGE